MYDHLQLFNLNGLKECSLSDLGQINVICGKNNSGKSTLLEAITRVDTRREGRDFILDDAKRYSQLLNNIWDGAVRTPGITSYIETRLKK